MQMPLIAFSMLIYINWKFFFFPVSHFMRCEQYSTQLVSLYNQASYLPFSNFQKVTTFYCGKTYLSNQSSTDGPCGVVNLDTESFSWRYLAEWQPVSCSARNYIHLLLRCSISGFPDFRPWRLAQQSLIYAFFHGSWWLTSHTAVTLQDAKEHLSALAHQLGPSLVDIEVSSSVVMHLLKRTFSSHFLERFIRARD